jgi:hypothetical protein
MAVVSPVSLLLPLAKCGQRPPDQRGGTTEVPEDAVQDLCALLWGLPLTIIFFTIVGVLVVTVGKGGHSLEAMECAPSFWLPWDDGCGLWCMMCRPAVHARAGMIRSNQPASSNETCPLGRNLSDSCPTADNSGKLAEKFGFWTT